MTEFGHRDIMTRAVDRMNDLGRRRIPFLFIIDYEMLHPRIYRLNELVHCDIEVQIDGRSLSRETNCKLPASIDFLSFPIPYEQYALSFQCVRDHFIRGNTYLANLTFPTRIETNLSLKHIYYMSEAPFKLRMGRKFVCFSPETFITIEKNTIRSFPMKGTIDADLPDAEATLMASEKELAEHITIVDLIRNDIGMIAESVEVVRFRYIDTIETPFKRLLQVSSEIRGHLAEDWHRRIGSILATLLPAGSICGAPKRKTVEIIKKAEVGPRGYYTGVFGVFDGRSVASGVMIRFIERRKTGTLYYRSGGGLTVYANPKDEYQEMMDKIYVPAVGNYSIRRREVSQSRSS